MSFAELRFTSLVLEVASLVKFVKRVNYKVKRSK